MTCAQCGFAYVLGPDEIVQRLEADAETFVEQLGALDNDAVRARPEPDVWSALEYACHLRDVLRVQRDRVALIQREDAPTLTPMGRDERVVEDRYNEQDPDLVGRELLDAAHDLAASLERLDDAGRRRTAVYNYPTTRLRTVEWIGNHTVHELQHHRHDISR